MKLGLGLSEREVSADGSGIYANPNKGAGGTLPIIKRSRFMSRMPVSANSPNSPMGQGIPNEADLSHGSGGRGRDGNGFCRARR